MAQVLVGLQEHLGTRNLTGSKKKSHTSRTQPPSYTPTFAYSCVLVLPRHSLSDDVGEGVDAPLHGLPD